MCGSWVRVGGHTRSVGWWQCHQACPACHCQAARLLANASTAGPSTHTLGPWCSFHRRPYNSQPTGGHNSEIVLEFWWVDGHRLQDLATVGLLVRCPGSAAAASDTRKDICVGEFWQRFERHHMTHGCVSWNNELWPCFHEDGGKGRQSLKWSFWNQLSSRNIIQ